jgi:hypothetical protein
VGSGRVTILGQTYQAPAGNAALQSMADQLSSGATVVAAVSGAKDTRGEVHAASFKATGISYAPGATNVLVVGRVTSSQTTTGTFAIGKLTVDYTSLLSTVSIQPRAGQTVAVVGVQSSAGSALQALQVRIVR